jgi:type III pantothenate kinase
MSAPLLLIDAGNALLKWATAGQAGVVTPEGTVPTDETTPEGVGRMAEKFPEHRAVLSSVVPKVVPYFQSAFQGRLHQVTSDSSALGLLFDYPNPAELGADRLSAAVAVREDGVGPTIIVQCGTATAFSVLDGDGRFCGGVIAPGPQVQLAALVGATAQLPTTSLGITAEVPGKSTRQAIDLGIMLGYRGGVNEILRQLCKESKPPLTSIILTGGNAQFLTNSLELPFTLRPLLVFEGLRIIGLRAFKDV